MENSVGVLNKSHVPPTPSKWKKNGYLVGNKEEEMFSKLNTVF